MKSYSEDSVPVGCESVSLGVFFRSFEDSQYLYFDLKVELKQSAETSRTTHLLTQPHTQEELNFHIQIICNKYFLG